MKTIFAFAGLLVLAAAACGDSSTADTDAGMANDSSMNGDSSSDASNDAQGMPDSGTDDSASGDSSSAGQCDPDAGAAACPKGQMCCSEPTHMPDAALSAFICVKPLKNGMCPLLP